MKAADKIVRAAIAPMSRNTKLAPVTHHWKNRCPLLWLFLISALPAFGQGTLVFSLANERVIAEDSILEASFSVGGSTQPGTIAITKSSQNTRLVPNENIQIVPPGVSGSVWQLIVRPTENQSGSATITLIAQDALKATGRIDFRLTVTPVLDPPTVRLLSPTSADQYLAGASIQLITEAVGVDGPVTSVEFLHLTDVGIRSIGFGAPSPSGNTWTSIFQGEIFVIDRVDQKFKRASGGVFR